jgi:hypothetical protein
MTRLSKTHSVTSARDRHDHARMRRLYSLTIIKGDAKGGGCVEAAARLQRGHDRYSVCDARRIHSDRNRRCDLPHPIRGDAQGHDDSRPSRTTSIPEAPAWLSPWVSCRNLPTSSDLEVPPLCADAIRRGGSIRGPESTQGRRASPRPVVRYRARPDANPDVCSMRSDHRPEVRCRRCTKRPRHRLQ